MEKLVYLCWGPTDRAKDRNRDVLLGECAPRLLGEGGARRLSMAIADSDSAIRSPGPKLRPGPRMSAVVSLWLDCVDDRTVAELTLATAGFRIAGYLVTESLYTDYGGNRHAPPRDWPDGQRSPGVLLVTAMEKPRAMTYDAWIAHWYGTQSPVSEAMQPRCRYVRMAIVRPLTAVAPPFLGLVEEAWPTTRHVTSPFLFYGARNVVELARNMRAMMRSVNGFLRLWQIETTPMSEYLLRTA